MPRYVCPPISAHYGPLFYAVFKHLAQNVALTLRCMRVLVSIVLVAQVGPRIVCLEQMRIACPDMLLAAYRRASPHVLLAPICCSQPIGAYAFIVHGNTLLLLSLPHCCSQRFSSPHVNSCGFFTDMCARTDMHAKHDWQALRSIVFTVK